MKRGQLVTLVIALIVIATGLSLVLYPQAPGTSSAVRFSTLTDGVISGSMTEEKNLRISSAEEFAMIWKSIYGDEGVSTMPSVNFDTDEVLAVFDGTHPTGGYAIRVASITDANGTRFVVIEHTTPGTGCITNQMVTSPFEMALVPKTDATLTHEDVTKVASCE